MRYFFHIRDGRILRDHEGTELSDPTSARVEAIRLAGSLLTERARSGWDGTEWRLTVVDETGAAVFLLRYSADDLVSGQSGSSIFQKTDVMWRTES